MHEYLQTFLHAEAQQSLLLELQVLRVSPVTSLLCSMNLDCVQCLEKIHTISALHPILLLLAPHKKKSHWLRRPGICTPFVSCTVQPCHNFKNRHVGLFLLTDLIIVLLTSLFCPERSFYGTAAVKPATVTKGKPESLAQATWAPRAVETQSLGNQKSPQQRNSFEKPSITHTHLILWQPLSIFAQPALKDNM